MITEIGLRRSPGEDTKLVEYVELIGLDASRRIERAQRSRMGQFLTPAPVAELMAAMFETDRPAIRLLDAGAGIGILTAAFVEEFCRRAPRTERLHVDIYEVEPLFSDYLSETMRACEMACKSVGIEFHAEVHEADFLEAAVSRLRGSLFSTPAQPEFDCAILNPPYLKIRNNSRERLLLSSIGVEATNLYSAFLALVVQLLCTEGEIVAIIPRSFCNGPYFKPFRRLLLDSTEIRQVHLFNKRRQAFSNDDVLQENVILRAVKGKKLPETVLISESDGPDGTDTVRREAPYSELVNPHDPDLFIHIVADRAQQEAAQKMQRLSSTLEDLGLEVSTGRVVDFRARDFLRALPRKDTVPLIYPGHLKNGSVEWSRQLARKPNAIVRAPATEGLLVPPGVYILVKRFSAKEETKRVVAAVCDAEQQCEGVGFENHLNYFHENGGGLPRAIARGLMVFLSSTLTDICFRQFSGHTQVNATDLRKMRYPSRKQLEALGLSIGEQLPGQEEIDRIVEEVLGHMASGETSLDPVQVKRQIERARGILRDLGLPRTQVNDRSALTLLALLDLRPDTPWSDAREALRGITEMMNFFSECYGKNYAPNTRETVRRQTVHQFIQAGLVIQNPDDLNRPTNSPNNRYQISRPLFEVLRTYGTGMWNRKLREYLTSGVSLADTYAKKREMHKVPVQLAPGKTIELSPGGQTEVVRRIIEDFCPRYTPGAEVIYVGDTASKWAYFDPDKLNELGVAVDEHGKMPDVVVYYSDKGWLVLIEACSSHGPVDHKRHIELKELFEGATVGLVFVTAFPDRRTLTRCLVEIAWETEVWVAEHPDHLIHFNGERFLGPYEFE